jgi:hypothetical protein
VSSTKSNGSNPKPEFPGIKGSAFFVKPKEKPAEPGPSKEERPPMQVSGAVSGFTGDEGEHVWFEECARLYSYCEDTNKTSKPQEIGPGIIKLLENPQNGKMRCIMRLLETNAVCASFRILPHFQVQVSKAGDEILGWNCKVGA